MTTINAFTKGSLATLTILSALLVFQPAARANEAWDCTVRRVTDAAQCGTDYIVDAAQCGWDYVTSGARCGWSTVTDAAKCGTEYFSDAAHCGWDYVTSAAKCGWDWFSSLFSRKRKPKSCKLPKTCELPKTCQIEASCNIPRGCDLPATCDIEECVQPEPGGDCVPGAVYCDIEGFTCDPLEWRCLPSYQKTMDVEDYDFCESKYDDVRAFTAQELGVAMTYGKGFSITAVGSGSLEVGTVYGEDGQYGCYRTTCVGLTSDLSFSGYWAFGVLDSWSAVGGDSWVTAEGAGFPIIELAGFTTAQVFDADWNLIGTADSLSFGVGVLPVQVQLLHCTTTVYEVYGGTAESSGQP